MPRDIHAALSSAAKAAAIIRTQISSVAAAVESGNDEAILIAARVLVTGDAGMNISDSPDTPEATRDLGTSEGEPP